ncbi:hypothetical protein N184_31430 [Sinorhizobium sp. GL28]|nr:hypothetical protein N184_31430 [Sinorhizobium sp. GL28]
MHDLIDMRAGTAPDRTFVIFNEAAYTYKHIADLSLRYADRLRQNGIRPGHRVMVLMHSCEVYLAIWFAISRVGAIESPVNPAYKGQLLRQLIETADPALCIVADDFLDEFRLSSEGLVDPSMIYSPDSFLALQWVEPCPRLQIDPRDTAAIIFTSGTTGRSKAVMISHNHQLSFGQAFAEITGLSESDTAYNFLPFFHIAAKFVALATLLTGAKMLLRPGFSASNFWPDVRRHGATVCSAVGGLCHMLQSQPQMPDDSSNPMRLIYAVPVPWEFKQSFEERFGLRLVEGYGGTECNLVAYSRLDEPTPRGSCGRPSPYFDIEIQDGNGRRAAPGEGGEICVRPKHPATMMNGYFGMPEKSLETMTDFWFHTGDRGYFDTDGYLFFLDRLKDSIRRRGENISSFEVERILNSHPAIAESAVIPEPSELGEDEVKAVIVLKPNQQASEEDIFRFAVDNMPYFMVPRFVELRKELPRTPTMKIKKAELTSQGNSQGTWDCEKAGLRATRLGLVLLGTRGS